ncbi:SDR family NAD(P)-dependent oxidoreductase [Enemella sp. A6]|uniref:SDR family NAD(P)-dependent oxidoreductase n=1 Tax=Enemella sp. A6 TaxID=3440152 RepID=UPI003EC0CD7A
MTAGTLDGLRILVTGGGSGIGLAAVRSYLEAGATVTVLDRNVTALTGHDSGRLQAIEGDALSADALQGAVDAVGAELDQLTCCVGTFDGYTALDDIEAADLATAATEVWQVNVLSALLAIRVSLPALRRATAPASITLTLSESAFHPVGGGVLYGSSKWALRGVVSHLSTNLAPQIRVNGVAPGGTGGTKFSGAESLGLARQSADTVPGRDARIAAGTLLQLTPQPEDHAGAYQYLADPRAARCVTGVVINSDGGRKP